MSCRFCNAPTSESRTCFHCRRLIDSGFWSLLAHTWLTYRPQDWADDVGAFLEFSEGLGAPPPDLVTPTDAQTLDAVAGMLADPDWGVGMLEDIAELVTMAGRTLENPTEISTWERH